MHRIKSLLSWLNQVGTYDFCPNYNKYVYWLKEPIGWFLVALACSLLVGAFLSPLGWSIALGIAIVLALGLGFPWLAIATARCEISCNTSETYEREPVALQLKITNPLPLPIMGLVVEGYFKSPAQDQDGPFANADCGLARIPPLSSASYQLQIVPEYRGEYPNGVPKVSCSFPFGIYTAKKKVVRVAPVLVRPLTLPLLSDVDFSGQHIADVGDGSRPTTHGDFMGVREFRRGDSLRSIHWIQSARLDNLVVCERGGPQKSKLSIRLSTRAARGSETIQRDNLAWRIRVTASLIKHLAVRHIAFDLEIDGKRQLLGSGNAAYKMALNHLARIPLNGNPAEGLGLEVANGKPLQQGFAIDIPDNLENDGGGEIIRVLAFQNAEHSWEKSQSLKRLINTHGDIQTQLDTFLQEMERANV